MAAQTTIKASEQEAKELALRVARKLSDRPESELREEIEQGWPLVLLREPHLTVHWAERKLLLACFEDITSAELDELVRG